MKKRILYSVIAAILIVGACRKEDNPKLPDLVRVPTPVLTLDEGVSDTKFDLVRPDTFFARFEVGLVFESDVKPQKLDVVIMKNGDTANAKVFKPNVTTYPSTFEITGTDLIALFSQPIVAGDKFAISVNITTENGSQFLAFPPAGAAGWGASIVSQNGGNPPTLLFSAPCIFHIEDYVGDYTVVLDEWADFAAGSDIAVQTIGRDTLAFNFATNPSYPIYIKVDTVLNQTSVAKQVYGDYPQFGITNISAASVPSADNIVDPCIGLVSVRLNHTDPANYGNYTIVLRKK